MPRFGFKFTKNLATTLDTTAPTVVSGQTISYAENRATGATLGVVSATDNVAVTGFRFTTTASSTSSDGYFSISNSGVVTITSTGAAGAANDFETLPNSFTHSVQARDAAGNWSTGVNVTFTVTDVSETSGAMIVGMNLGGMADYTGCQPFANLLRVMRAWVRVDDGSFSHCQTQDQGQITGATTERWMSVVLTHEAGLPTQTLRVLNPNANKILVTGAYGDPGPGVFTTSTAFDYNYVTGSDLEIYAEGNVSGTMAILQAGHEASYASGNEWTSDVVTFHTTLGTRVLRFMDANGTNSNRDQTWSDRTVTGKVNFYGSAGGVVVPYEVQADLCNRVGADMWVNVPARASTTTYTPQLASLLASTLNAGRKVYVERGNEIWNMFGGFYANTAWIMRNNHTRFNITASGPTFTKTAHGYTNGQGMQVWLPAAAVKTYGVGEATQLTSTAWATGVSYTAGQYIVGNFDGATGGDRYICLTSHTSGATFAGDLAGGKWQRVEWYQLTYGSKGYIKVLSANTFELWSNYSGGTFSGVKYASVPQVTSLIAILTDEGGAIADEAAALNTRYGELCLADWTAFDTAFGGTTRIKACLGSQAAGAGTWTAGRLAVTGVAARCNHLHIAPYHTGIVWGGKVVPASGKITPYFWTREDGATAHCTVYTSGSTPTMAQRKAGTGTGFQTRLTPMAVNSSGQSWTTGADVTIANGTYKVYMDFVDVFGYTWTVSNTVVVGAGQPTVDFVDTDANQQVRDLFTVDYYLLPFIASHQALIAASSNPAITIVNYEGGSHQDYYPPTGSGVETWYKAHRKSTTYGTTIQHYYDAMAAAGVKLHTHYSDVSGQGPGGLDTPWRISETYANRTDNRYLAVAAYAGSVPIRTLVDFGTVTGNTITSEPTYPFTVATFSDATLTYSVMPQSSLEDGTFSISGNVLSLTGTGSINYAVPATQYVWIRATDGHTDSYFRVNFTTGNAWYESNANWAWSSVDDSTPAVMNALVGTLTSSSSGNATVVTGGWDLTGANYNTGAGGSTTALAFTDSPLFAIVARQNGDTSSYVEVANWGSGNQVSFLTMGASNLQVYWNNGGGTEVGVNIPWDNTLAVLWVWFDNANHLVYMGKNQTVVTPTGGTSYADQGSTTFTFGPRFGSGGTTAVLGGAESCPAVGTLTQAKAIIQRIQTKHSIA